MNKEKILKRLEEHLDIARQSYNDDRILGIFLYGSQNYGFATEKSDIDSKIIYLPAFEEFCLQDKIVSDLLFDKKNNEHIEIKDIRLMRVMFMKQNINFIELLYTEYYILNPKYKNLFNKYFIANREDIAHYDCKKTLESISGQLLHTLKQDPYDDKKLYNAQRLYYFLEDYLAGMPYEYCLRPSGDKANKLKSLKAGNFFNEKRIWKNNKNKKVLADYIEKQVEELRSKYADYNFSLNKNALSALNNGVIEILKYSFNEDFHK